MCSPMHRAMGSPWLRIVDAGGRRACNSRHVAGMQPVQAVPEAGMAGPCPNCLRKRRRCRSRMHSLHHAAPSVAPSAALRSQAAAAAPVLPQRRLLQHCTPDAAALGATAKAPTLVPSWRMMMPPAFTGWPPYTLTPRRLDTESRPARRSRRIMPPVSTGAAGRAPRRARSACCLHLVDAHASQNLDFMHAPE